ncbi:hypothetical protein ACRB68_01710 [Actinomadura sp. RB68]|uniref:DUF4177 domain-containing protein n=1 Tax=Actinomadura macrotermitis TaxID=2585200 RepID=A0A7K0BN47_9ACTN|nr:hypothetical protein [Actinomadura macrotermitis]
MREQEETRPRQWEYRTTQVGCNALGAVNSDQLQRKLDRAGRGGWQCAGVLGPDRLGIFTLVFQRPCRSGDG